jgi:hypothetical protein
MIIKIALGYLVGKVIYNFLDNAVYAYAEYKLTKK